MPLAKVKLPALTPTPFKVAKLLLGVSTFWVSVPPPTANVFELPELSVPIAPLFSNFKKKPLEPYVTLGLAFGFHIPDVESVSPKVEAS